MRSSTRTGSTVQLALDSLESRLTPAGNLSVFVADGTLYIQGDRQSHIFTVEVHDTRFIVRALDTTRINGLGGTLNYAAEFPGDQNVIRALVIEGNSMNDSVSLHDHLTTTRNLDVMVNTQAGGDNFSLWKYGEGLIQGNMNIDMGSGYDNVLIRSNWNNVSMGINLGAGNDTLKFNGTVGELRYLDGAGGKDALEIFDAVYQTYRTRITGIETITRI